MDMNIVCLDLEGVLVPEIWIAFAEASGIPELKRTTRDEPDYDKLMKWRLGILKEHGLGLKEIQETIAKIDPIPGAKEFLDELRSITQVIIISDTFSQFAGPLMKKLGYPTIFCNSLEVADNGEITGFTGRSHVYGQFFVLGGDVHFKSAEHGFGHGRGSGELCFHFSRQQFNGGFGVAGPVAVGFIKIAAAAAGGKGQCES